MAASSLFNDSLRMKLVTPASFATCAKPMSISCNVSMWSVVNAIGTTIMFLQPRLPSDSMACAVDVMTARELTLVLVMVMVATNGRLCVPDRFEDPTMAHDPLATGSTSSTCWLWYRGALPVAA